MKKSIITAILLFVTSLVFSQNLLRHYEVTIPNGDTLTTEWESCYNFPAVITNVFSDREVTLRTDFTNDQINIDSSLPVSVDSLVNEVHRITNTRAFLRLRIINNSGGTASVRYGYLLGTYDHLTSLLNSTIQSDADALIVRPSDTDLDVSRGIVGNQQLINKFGKNTAVGSVNLTPICQGGFYRTPTSATTLEVVSSAAADNASGAGARAIEYTVVNENWEWEVDTVATHASDGTIAVTLPVDALRLITWRVIESGTYASQAAGSHVGTLTIQESGGGAVWSTIPLVGGLGVGRSQIAALTVPAGKEFYLYDFNFGVQSTKTANLLLFSRNNTDDTSSPYSGAMNVRWEQDGLVGPGDVLYKYPIKFDEKTDVGFMAITTSGTTTSITVNFNGVFVDK